MFLFEPFACCFLSFGMFDINQISITELRDLFVLGLSFYQDLSLSVFFSPCSFRLVIW